MRKEPQPRKPYFFICSPGIWPLLTHDAWPVHGAHARYAHAAQLSWCLMVFGGFLVLLRSLGGHGLSSRERWRHATDPLTTAVGRHPASAVMFPLRWTPVHAFTRRILAQTSHALCDIRAINVEIIRKSRSQGQTAEIVVNDGALSDTTPLVAVLYVLT